MVSTTSVAAEVGGLFEHGQYELAGWKHLASITKPHHFARNKRIIAPRRTLEPPNSLQHGNSSVAQNHIKYSQDYALCCF